jgi:hypothetical protein
MIVEKQMVRSWPSQVGALSRPIGNGTVQPSSPPPQTGAYGSTLLQELHIPGSLHGEAVSITGFFVPRHGSLERHDLHLQYEVSPQPHQHQPSHDSLTIPYALSYEVSSAEGISSCGHSLSIALITLEDAGSFYGTGCRREHRPVCGLHHQINIEKS